MRTAIFVHEPSIVTIEATNPSETTAKIYTYGSAPESSTDAYQDPTATPAAGTHQLARGIYLVLSNGAMKVSGVQGDVQTDPTDKDDWPDPKPGVVALVPGATAASVKKFLTIAKGIAPVD